MFGEEGKLAVLLNQQIKANKNSAALIIKFLLALQVQLLAAHYLVSKLTAGSQRACSYH